MLFIDFFLLFGAFFLSFSLFTPSVMLARAVGAIDIPNERKRHARPTARVGGSAFFVAFMCFLPLLPVTPSLKAALVVGGSTVFLIGFLDDALKLSPFAKLTGQLLAISLYSFTAEMTDGQLSVTSGILSVFWITLITNATNLIDGLDGLAGGISSCQALCIAVLALVSRNTDIFWCAVLLIAVVLGFLPQNAPRAKTFMGDCGALFLGFMLGAISSRLVLENNDLITLLAILLIFRVPCADTVQSFARRMIARKNPFAADRGHFHHKLLDIGFTKECAVLLLIAASLLFGLVGVIIAVL